MENPSRSVIRGPAASVTNGTPLGTARARTTGSGASTPRCSEQHRNLSIRYRSITEKIVEPPTYCIDQVTRRCRQCDGPILGPMHTHRRHAGSEVLGAVLQPD